MSGFIVSLFWFLLIVGGGVALAYNRVDLRTSTVASAIALLTYTIFGSGGLLLDFAALAAVRPHGASEPD